LAKIYFIVIGTFNKSCPLPVAVGFAAEREGSQGAERDSTMGIGAPSPAEAVCLINSPLNCD